MLSRRAGESLILQGEWFSGLCHMGGTGERGVIEEPHKEKDDLLRGPPDRKPQKLKKTHFPSAFSGKRRRT